MFAAGRAIKKNSLSWFTVGVTHVDDKTYVLVLHDTNQVQVFDNYFENYLGSINVPGYKPDYRGDMTSCVGQKCLYMSDVNNKCIVRYELASKATSKWSVPAIPYGLSGTPSGNLLVTCRVPNKLVELSADSGQLVRQITPQADIEDIFHSVQLTTDQYLVCHGAGTSGSLNRVCEIGVDGKITRSYGGKCGPGDRQLNTPCYLGVAEARGSYPEYIIVADRENARLVWLSPKLELVQFLDISWTHVRPNRICVRQAARTLFVGPYENTLMFHCQVDNP